MRFELFSSPQHDIKYTVIDIFDSTVNVYNVQLMHTHSYCLEVCGL